MVAKTEPESLSPTLTLEEFAALERIGMTECRDLARRNAFPFPVLRLGREYRISRKAYEAWRDGVPAGAIQTVMDRERPRLILRYWTPSLISVWLDTTPGALGWERIWMLDPVLPAWAKENVMRYLPDIAANSLSGITNPGSAEYLSQNPAIMVVAVWVVGLLAIAAFVLNRRDV